MRLGQAVAACQFGDCRRRGRERTISYFLEPNKRITIHPIVCDGHYRRMREAEGPEWNWLTTLRHDLN